MSNKYKKIILTGDIFRSNHLGNGSQDINITWLYEALKPALKLAANLPIEKQLFSRKDISLTQAGYQAIESEVSLEGWAKLYKYKQIDETFLMNVWLAFKDSIVMAFELPEILRDALDTLGIPFVDIIIHPVRFLDDIIFGIRSNHREISKLFTQYIVPEESILLQAGMVMASMSRLNRLEIEGKAALFAGQTTDDKVLIHQNKFYKVKDFCHRLAEISANYDSLLIKAHPYSLDPFEAISISRLFPNCQIVTDNFYYLMSHENIATVYSISSSTSIEAKYLGKEGYHFAEYPFRFTEEYNEAEFKLGSFFTVDEVIFSGDFWRKILSPIITTSPITNIQIPKKPNRIRTSLRSFWGFNFVDTDIICDLYKK